MLLRLRILLPGVRNVSCQTVPDDVVKCVCHSQKAEKIEFSRQKQVEKHQKEEIRKKNGCCSPGIRTRDHWVMRTKR